VKVDIEVVLKNLKDTLVDNLNTKLAEIDAEKNDGITLKQIQSGAYILQSLDEFPVNFDPALYYGVESVATSSEYGASAKNLRLEVTVILADPQDGSVYSRLFRYQRALEEIFTSNYPRLKKMYDKVKVTGLEPIAFRVQNQTTEFKAIGIILELDLFT
jgi:hypothetical protein